MNDSARAETKRNESMDSSMSWWTVPRGRMRRSVNDSASRRTILRGQMNEVVNEEVNEVVNVFASLWIGVFVKRKKISQFISTKRDW